MRPAVKNKEHDTTTRPDSTLSYPKLSLKFLMNQLTWSKPYPSRAQTSSRSDSHALLHTHAFRPSQCECRTAKYANDHRPPIARDFADPNPKQGIC